MTRIVQIGMCTADLPRSVRRYSEVFGFQDAGGRMLWGPRSANIQMLGDDANAALWWLVGAQEFFNLEFFHHTLPAQRALPPGWLPNALGWVRWGIAVANFDAVVARLDNLELSQVVTVDGLRRACFRDPDVGVVVEVMEDGAGLPKSRVSNNSSGPRVVYATLSVSDLAAVRAFYVEAMEMAQVAEQLHTPAMEAMWGLPCALRDMAVLDGDGVFLELVQYIDPKGSRRADLRLSDQGIMNIAVGYRERSDINRAIARAIAGGCKLNAPLAESEPAATYVTDPLGNSIEMIWIPSRLDGDYGLAARPPAYR